MEGSRCQENSNEAPGLKQTMWTAQTIEAAEIPEIKEDESGLKYIATDRGVVITGYNTEKGLAVTIPDILGGNKVIGIGDDALAVLL